MGKFEKNIKLFPMYQRLSVDFLFFYTINILFLTQIKNIAISDVVLVDAMYSLFVVALQIPASLLVEKIGRKRSIVLGNFCNCLYLILIIISKDISSLIIAEIMCALAFALKDIAEPTLLNESIPKIKGKSELFAKITGKGRSGYFFLNAISILISGFLFEINGYIPMSIALCIVIIAFIISNFFKEPVIQENPKVSIKEEIVELKKAFGYIGNSKRVRCLIAFSTFIYGFLCVLASYEVSLFEELGISSSYIGAMFALFGIIGGIAGKNQDKFHNKYRNKSLTVIGILISGSCLVAGTIAELKLPIYLCCIICAFMYGIKYAITSIYYILIDKYLRNFANEEIDTKIFAAKSLFNSISSALMGIIASVLLTHVNTAKAMIIFGSVMLLLSIILYVYMKDKVGLSPEEYSDEEKKYDENKVAI